jgi:CheY-like chemotaxis protein
MMRNMTAYIEKLSRYIGKRLSDKRIKKGMTLSDMANQMGVSLQLASAYESGQSEINAACLYTLAQSMDVNFNYFFDGFKPSPQCIDSAPNDIIQRNRSSTLNVLLIEDDDACVLLTRKAFKTYPRDINIHVIHDGVRALEFLLNPTVHVPFVCPDIILLDLRLPKTNGFSILRDLKQNDSLSHIPVIVLSNTINEKDIITCYHEQASGFIGKPFDFDVFERNIHILAQYWAQTVVLPSSMINDT